MSHVGILPAQYETGMPPRFSTRQGLIRDTNSSGGRCIMQNGNSATPQQTTNRGLHLSLRQDGHGTLEFGNRIKVAVTRNYGR